MAHGGAVAPSEPFAGGRRSGRDGKNTACSVLARLGTGDLSPGICGRVRVGRGELCKAVGQVRPRRGGWGNSATLRRRQAVAVDQNITRGCAWTMGPPSCISGVEVYAVYNFTRETPALEAKRQRCAEDDAVGSSVVHAHAT